MAKASQQHTLDHVRRPRVQITYDVDTNGAMEKRELPFMVAILADLLGNTKPKKTLEKRSWTPIDRDNFNEIMAQHNPSVSVRVENTLRKDGTELPVNLKFENIKDFDPGAIARQIPALKELLDKRRDLERVLAMMDGNQDLENLLLDTIANTQKAMEQAKGDGGT